MLPPPPYSSLRLLGGAFALLVGVAGCTPESDIGGPCAGRGFVTGSDPCGQQFYYPSGVTSDPGDPSILYVSNANADLRYSSGTVVTVDTALFECAMSYVCKGPRLYDPTCTPYQGIPAGCEAYAEVLGALHQSDSLTGERAGCHDDSFDPLVVECDEEIFLGSAVRVGNFAGSIRVQTDPPTTEGGINRRLWLPARGDPSITFVEARETGAAGDTGRAKLVCKDPDPHGADVPDSCINQRIVVRDFHDPSEPGFNCLTDQSTCVDLPAEPFGVYVDQGCTLRDAQGNCISPYAHLLVTHLQSGEITLINANAFDPASTIDHKPTEDVVLDVRGNFFPADSAGRQGSFSVVPQDPGNPLSWWYVTTRVAAQVALFRIADPGVIVPGPVIDLAGPYAVGSDGRDLVFDPCTADNPGCRAFAVNNNPPSVYTIDTRVDTQGGMTPGVPRNDVIDIVSVCQGPARIAFRSTNAEGPEGSRVVNRVYVACFNSGEVIVIDPDLSAVVASTIVGRSATEMAFNFGFDEVRKRELPTPAHRRLYVTDFLNMNVAVIDLDPNSPTENHVIGRIGITDPPRAQ